MWKRPRVPSLSLAGLVLLVCSIATACSMLTRYPVETEGLLRDFESGSGEDAFLQADKRSKKGLNRLVYLLEGGMILHTRGNLEESNAVFQKAESVIRHYDEKAVLSLSQGSAELASLVVNEKALPYRGEPFERVLVNAYKAENYLFMGDDEGARVEIRRSYARQRENQRLYRKEVRLLQEETRRRGLSSRRIALAVESAYQDQEAQVRRLKRLYENTFAYYLSAIVYERNHEYNDAYIDLTKVQALQPGVPYVENDLLRMARLSGLSDSLEMWENRLGKRPRLLNRQQEGEILIFFGCGMAPRKTQVSISMSIPDVGIIALAFPKYEPVPNPIRYGALYDRRGRYYGRTFVLTDLEATAIRNLLDRMPALALKQVLRAALKGALVKTAKDEGGWAAELMANLFASFSEQADLRCWQTLPQNIQVARIPLQAGSHELVFALHGRSGERVAQRAFHVEVRPGQMIFVNARTGPWDLIGFNVFPSGQSAGNEVQ